MLQLVVIVVAFAAAVVIVVAFAAAVVIVVVDAAVIVIVVAFAAAVVICFAAAVVIVVAVECCFSNCCCCCCCYSNCCCCRCSCSNCCCSYCSIFAAILYLNLPFENSFLIFFSRPLNFRYHVGRVVAELSDNEKLKLEAILLILVSSDTKFFKTFSFFFVLKK